MIPCKKLLGKNTFQAVIQKIEHWITVYVTGIAPMWYLMYFSENFRVSNVIAMCWAFKLFDHLCKFPKKLI